MDDALYRGLSLLSSRRFLHENPPDLRLQIRRTATRMLGGFRFIRRGQMILPLTYFECRKKEQNRISPRHTSQSYVLLMRQRR